MLRHSCMVSCLVLVSLNHLHAALPPLLPIPSSAQLRPRESTITAYRRVQLEVPFSEGIRCSLVAVIRNLEANRMLPCFNNRFCPVHGTFEGEKTTDHMFSADSRMKMSLRNVTPKNGQAWIGKAGDPAVKQRRKIAIHLLTILGYDEESKALIEEVLSYNWSCSE